MPITVEFRDDECLAIVTLIGNLEAIEIETVNRNELLPFLLKHSLQRIDVIWDVRQFEWDFTEFVKFLSMAKERRAKQPTPLNFMQHYVGHNTWIQSFRTWTNTLFGDQTSLFLNLEDAFAYIERQKATPDKV